VQALMADPSRSRARWLASMVMSPKVHEVFAWGDPLPFVTWLSRRVRAHLPGHPRWQPSA
jgi:hypothetical protein